MQSDIYMASAEEIQTVIRPEFPLSPVLIFKFIPMPKYLA